MNQTPFLRVESEIGKLEAVLLHRPGVELETLTPQHLPELLFDDIPWLERMQEEHDQFAETLRSKGCEVLYYQQLLCEIVENGEVKARLIQNLLNTIRLESPALKEKVSEFLTDLTPEELVKVFIGGLRKDQISYNGASSHLSFYIKNEYPYYINPLPNLYFTRDPGAVIGTGISINSMKTEARQRETMLLHHIYKHHPRFQLGQPPMLYDYNFPDSIEGGDILVLSKKVVAIGCSARTSTLAIERIARTLFESSTTFEQVLVVQIPFTRAYMHLDTVFTMVDYDKFTIYPGVEKLLKIFKITKGTDQTLKISEQNDLTSALKTALGIPSVQFIHSGGGDLITAAREQWNDSTNTLAIAPGVVVTYNRNTASNDTLRKHGIEVVEIEGSELVRGRGGPRCMSMPLRRDEI